MAVLPTTYGWQSATPGSDDPTQLNSKNEYRRFASKRGAAKQRWRWDLHLRRTPYTQALAFWSWLVDQGGTGGIWDLPNPLESNGTLQFSGSPRARQAAGKGQSSVPLEFLAANATNILLPGDFIQFASHKKVYKVSAPVNANGSGQGTVTFYPPLYYPVSGLELMKAGDDVLFQVALESDMTDIQIAISNSKYADPRIDVVEVG